MTKSDRLDSILEFLEVLDMFKAVYRAAYLSDHSRHESDAEHTWHVCMFALLCYAETELELDMRHVLELLLTHDLVEIYAGDTYVHQVADRAAARVREGEAAAELFSLLPPDLQNLIDGWWKEFEDGDTSEARYARAMDRLHGFAQNIYAGGRVWQERSVTEAMTRAVNKDAIELDPSLARIYEVLYARALRDHMWQSPETQSMPE